MGKNLHQRMLDISSSIGWVEKGGRNDFHGYDYVRAEDIKAAVQRGCVANGVTLYTSVDNVRTEVIGDGQKRAVLAVASGTFRWVNADAPDEVVTTGWAGQGVDSADKAVAKAVTNGIKYGMLNSFIIPTGDDPDASGETLPGAEVEVRRVTERAPVRQPAERVSSNSPAADRCPKHDRPWTEGKYGPYCTARDTSTERGFCTMKPSLVMAGPSAPPQGGDDDGLDNLPF